MSLPYIWVHDMVQPYSVWVCGMKTTLNLDDQVLKNAKEQAAKDGITLTAFVEQALKARLLQDTEKVTYRFQPKVVKGSKPPNVDISERDALYDVIDNS